MNISDKKVVRNYEYKGVDLVLIEEYDREGNNVSEWHFVLEGKERTAPSLRSAMGRVDDLMEVVEVVEA